MGGFLCTTVNTKLFHFFYQKREFVRIWHQHFMGLFTPCELKIKEQLEDIKEKKFKQQRKFSLSRSLSLGMNGP